MKDPKPVPRRPRDPNATQDTERLRFVARNHGISLDRLRSDIDKAMKVQRRTREVRLPLHPDGDHGGTE